MIAAAVLERQARDNLSGSWLRSRAIDPVHVSIAAGQLALIVCGLGRGGIGARQNSSGPAELQGLWTGQEQTVEYVVEFCPDLELEITLAVHKKVTAQAHGF